MPKFLTHREMIIIKFATICENKKIYTELHRVIHTCPANAGESHRDKTPCNSVSNTVQLCDTKQTQCTQKQCVTKSKTNE